MVFHKLRKLCSLFSALLVFVGLVGLLSFSSPVLAVSGNLVTTNPGFETGNFDGWDNTSGWVNQTSVKHSGSRAAYCNFTGGGSCTNSFKSNTYSVTAGHTIQISIWGYFSNSSSTITLEPIWVLSSGSTYAEPQSVMDTSGTWQNLKLNLVAPVNATGVRIKASISTINGSYYLDDAEIYDYYPDRLNWEYVDMNDNPDSQVTTEGVDTSGLLEGSAWLEAVSTKKPKVQTTVYLDLNEDNVYQKTEKGIPGVSVTQDKCFRTGGLSDICSAADFNSGSSTHKTGTTTADKGIMTVKWSIPSQGKYVRQTTTPPAGFYCNDDNSCDSHRFVVANTVRLRQGILPAITGVLKVQTSTECTNNSLPSECYKLYFDGGSRWITRATTLSQSELTSREGKRVTINGPFHDFAAFPWAGSPRKAKSIVTVDYTVHYGLGGGDVADLVNNTTIQNDLSKPSTHPSAVWSQIEPNAPSGGVHTYNTISTTVSSDLYKGMKYCKDNNLTGCGVTLTWDDDDVQDPGNGLPLWVESGTQQVCGDGVAAQHVGDLAALAAYIANSTIDGVAIKNIADSFALYNEPDLGGAGSSCTVDNYLWQYETVATMLKQGTVSARMSTAGFGLEDSQKAGSLQWVDDFLGRVNPNLVDRINVHWYENMAGSSNPQWSDYDTYTGRGGVRAKLIWLNQVLQKHGISGKTVTLGEIGDGEANNSTGDAIQRDNLFKEFAQVYSANLPISSVLWFKLIGSTGNWGGESLIYNGTNRPSYTAYKAIAAELNGSRFFRYDTTSGIEGYIFLDANNSAKEVIWSRTDNPVNVQFWGNSVRKVDTAGNVSTINGSGGYTTVSITKYPVIIDY